MDRSEVSSLYEQYKNGIFRYALSILKDPQLAQDALHDTFVILLSGKGPRDPDKIQPWLYRVARNLCFDQLRKGKRLQLLSDPVSRDEYRYEFIELITSLSVEDREIVTLKIVGGLTHKEIGTVLGIHPKTAQKRYERAIAALRNKEDEYGTKTV